MQATAYNRWSWLTRWLDSASCWGTIVNAPSQPLGLKSLKDAGPSEPAAVRTSVLVLGSNPTLHSHCGRARRVGESTILGQSAE